MSEETEEDKLSLFRKVSPHLTPRESSVYLVFKENGLNVNTISPDTIAGFYNLFLNGKSCVDIQQMNKGWSLGQIVALRIENNWDDKRKEHIESLLEKENQNLTQLRSESISFISSALSATHKFWSEKILKYLQTGDEAHIQDLPIKSMGFYKSMQAMLKDILEVQSGSPSINVTVKSAPPTERTIEGQSKVIQNEDEVRAALLAGLSEKLKKT